MERKLFKIDCDKITNGSYLFRDCKNLTKFDCDMPNLTDGSYMFNHCDGITTFNSDLSKLTNADYMFANCDGLKSFHSDLSSLTDGGCMFIDCTNLKSFSSNLSSLTNGYDMFYRSGLVSFNSGLPSLTNGEDMFKGCKLNAKSVNCILTTIPKNPSSQYAQMHIGMSEGGLEKAADIIGIEIGTVINNPSTFTFGSWDLCLYPTGQPSYTIKGYKYKGCTTVDEVTAKNSNYLTTDIVDGAWTELLCDLTNGSDMFRYCMNLESFSSDLSSLTNGSEMFHRVNIKSFASDLSSLTNGYIMFANCSNLTSFSSDLSSLTNGCNMFRYCSNLESFSSDLSSLTNGEYMFTYCKLDTASVQNIADSINTPSSKGTIYIGIGNTTPNEQEKSSFNKIASKNWTVYVGVGGGNSTQWNPTSLTPIDGEEQQTPIPFWAKPVPSDKDHASYIDNDGNYYNILGGNYVYGDDLSTYGMFISEEDAAANMRLIKCTKTEE